MDLVTGALARAFRFVNRFVQWYRLPFPLALVNLGLLREDLRWLNLFDTQRKDPPPPDPWVDDVRANRSADGSHNDLSKPWMGQAHSRFGRNVPLERTYPETPPDLLDPNPRLVSRELLARPRDAFKPVPHLNVLAAGWLQFMVHDWFTHGTNAHPDDESIPKELREPIRVPLPEGDDWPNDPMVIFRTRPDLPIDEADEGKPPAYRNLATQWWDASQLYGSKKERLLQLRTVPETGALEPGGKLHLPNGYLPLIEVERTDGTKGELELTGENGNFWIGLSVLHTLFAREHNLLCDHLAQQYPDRDGDWYFNKARLIVAALLAKIHTVEWTPALLNTPELRMSMRANWWGLLGERYVRGFGRVIKHEIVGGIIESPTEHHAAPYSITEEFNAVYRMHSLVPDTYSFRRRADDQAVAEGGLLDFAGHATHGLYEKLSLADAFYSLATEHPGLLVLNNLPTDLGRLAKQAPSSRTVDVGTIDILRDRERGVPRYCAMRRALRMPAPTTFMELTGGDRQTARRIETIYGDVEKVDLLVGCAAEKWPEGFGFSDTAFRIFILMASRRLKSDRFFTTDFTPEVYTPVGIRWVADNGMKSVLIRHMPELAPNLSGIKNAFFPWHRA